MTGSGAIQAPSPLEREAGLGPQFLSSRWWREPGAFSRSWQRLFHVVFCLRPRQVRHGLPSRGLAVAGETVKDPAGQARPGSAPQAQARPLRGQA